MQQELDILRKGIRGLGQTALDALAKGDMPSVTWFMGQMIEERVAIDREWTGFVLLANRLLSSGGIEQPKIVDDLVGLGDQKVRNGPS
jgi:hypothetical protein